VYEQWIHSVLPAPLTEALQVSRDRPWSLVVRVQTESGLFWFKENRGATRFEAGLMQAMARWAPGSVLAPVAVDPLRGWSLLPDGGATVREAGVADWPAMLARFARLQRDVAGHADQMLALGVPDHRPAKLAELAQQLPLPEGTLPRFQELCAELGDSVIPMSIQHDDLHDGNVFSSGRFFDWGDASVQHPFGVLLVSLRAAADRFGVPDGDPSLEPLRDAYLQPWSDLACRERLLREVRVAVHVTKVSRALSWQRALAHWPDPQEWGDPVGGWLGELLVDVPD
jgi:hypothetical protein